MSSCGKCINSLGLCKKCSRETFPFPLSSEENRSKTNRSFFDMLNNNIDKIQETGEDEQEDPFQAESKYYDIEQFNNVGMNNNKMFSIFHLNVASLTLNFDDLHTMLSTLNIDFDVIGITETRIKKHSPSTSNLNINGYSVEDTPTESSAGGTRLYISDKISYKRRSDLELSKDCEIESTFIEIINNNKINIIVGCIYRHPSMSVKEFNEDYLESFLQKISLEQGKKIFLQAILISIYLSVIVIPKQINFSIYWKQVVFYHKFVYLLE